MCAQCLRISDSQYRRGIRPWGWVAAEWRRRNPGEDPMTPLQLKRIHDRVIQRLRYQAGGDGDVADLLSPFRIGADDE